MCILQDIQSDLGKGSFGKVKLCRYNNKKYAIKILEKSQKQKENENEEKKSQKQKQNEEKEKRFFKEFFEQRRLNDPNIVKIKGWTQNGDIYGLIMEFMPGGDLLGCKLLKLS